MDILVCLLICMFVFVLHVLVNSCSDAMKVVSFGDYISIHDGVVVKYLRVYYKRV